jgi:hypothetical protein
MAAWKHWGFWDRTTYDRYRSHVAQEAAKFRGRTDLDCADMSLILLIDFAAGRGLPVTFWDNNRVRYISKATRQTPTSYLKASFTLTWKTQAEYTDAVRRRVGARALLEQNTLVNPRGPQPGDLMSAAGRADLFCKPVRHDEGGLPVPDVRSRGHRQLDRLERRGRSASVAGYSQASYFSNCIE